MAGQEEHYSLDDGSLSCVPPTPATQSTHVTIHTFDTCVEVRPPHTFERTLMGPEAPVGRLLSSQRTNAWPMKKAMPGVRLTGSFGTPVVTPCA